MNKKYIKKLIFEAFEAGANNCPSWYLEEIYEKLERGE